MAASIWRRATVTAESGLPRATLYLRIAQGLFVKQVSLGPRSVGWPRSECEAINAARIAGKSDDEIQYLVVKLHAARCAP